MCIDGAFEIRYNKVYISIKKIQFLISGNGYYVINGKASILEIYIS
jgi:hypothetical protein